MVNADSIAGYIMISHPEDTPSRAELVASTAAEYGLDPDELSRCVAEKSESGRRGMSVGETLRGDGARPSVIKVARALLEALPECDFEAIVGASEVTGIDDYELESKVDELRWEAEEEAQVRRRTVDVKRLHVLDLRDLPTKRTRIKGTAWNVTSKERPKFAGTEYLLLRETDNEFDPMAIAVYGKDRRVGYVGTADAGRISPLLANLDGDAFLVAGARGQSDTASLWLDLPTTPAIRAFVKAQGGDEGRRHRDGAHPSRPALPIAGVAGRLP